MSRLPPLLLALLLSSCAVGPDYQRPEFEYSDQWHTELNMDEHLQPASDVAWWKQFNDPLLTSLITDARENNRDLMIAMANVERAKGLRRMAIGGFLPSVDASASASRSRYSRQTGVGANTGTRNSFSTGLDASWELDLFGRHRRALEAADAEIEASEATRQGVMLSVIAEVAANYFEARGLQRQLVVTQHDILLLKEVEEIAQAQAEAGIISMLDLARAQGERETFESKLPALEAEIMMRIYRISVLTGRSPEHYAKAIEAIEPLPMPTDRVPVGLRSEILKRRPDIQSAERQLAAATANIGLAKANLFPSFSLTGAIGSSARVFSDLFTPGTLTSSAGGMLGWPLFAGGSLSGQVDVAEADAKAALGAYEQQVLLALEDVEGALTRYGKEWQTLKRLRAALATHQQAFEIAKLRYSSGEDDFLVILDAERTLTTTRNSIILSETRILTLLTQLYKALGGSW